MSIRAQRDRIFVTWIRHWHVFLYLGQACWPRRNTPGALQQRALPRVTWPAIHNTFSTYPYWLDRAIVICDTVGYGRKLDATQWTRSIRHLDHSIPAHDDRINRRTSGSSEGGGPSVWGESRVSGTGVPLARTRQLTSQASSGLSHHIRPSLRPTGRDCHART